MKKYRKPIVASIVLFFVIVSVLFYLETYKYYKNPELLVKVLESWNSFKSLFVFSLLSIGQVICAIVPGGPFEIVAGYMFGTIKGIIICDITMSLGSLIVFLCVRKWRHNFIEIFFDEEKINNVKIFHNKKKLTSILFMIFLIPGSPKDVITYGAGLSDLTISSWVFINVVGRLPAIILTILGASSLASKKYIITNIVIAAFIVFYLVGLKVWENYNKS